MSITKQHANMYGLVDKLGLKCHVDNWQVPEGTSVNLHGWNGGTIDVYKTVFGEWLDPKELELVVELGAWYGLGTCAMASVLKGLGSNAVILSVDTWLGSVEHWKEYKKELCVGEDGRPMFYQQWLNNVKLAGHSDCAIPLHMDSATAYETCKSNNLQPDVVFIDGNNSLHQVYADLRMWWEVLKPGGKMFGDDSDWKSVQQALKIFSSEIGTPFTTTQQGPWWFFSKQK